MSTVQAWGNLSAHDHAGSLGDSGVKVGLEEVVASLNSMVTILSWYAEKKGFGAAAAPQAAAPAPAPLVASAPPPSGSKTPMIAGGALLVIVLAAGGYFAFGAKTPVVDTPPPPKSDPFATLDTVYSTWKEPAPPVGCRRADDAPQLAKVATDAQALGLLENPSPEASYLLARASKATLSTPSAALSNALSCPGFAGAQHLAGLVAVRENKLPEAQKFYEEARLLAPNWLENREDLAALLVKTEQHEAAWKEVDGLISAAPDGALPYLLRGLLKNAKDDKAGFAADVCKAVKLGLGKAKTIAEGAGIQCS
jgi:hypothetical protein